MTPEDEKAIVERMARAIKNEMTLDGGISFKAAAQAAFDVVKSELAKRDEAIKWYKGVMEMYQQHEGGE